MGPSGAGKTTLLNFLSGLPGSVEEKRTGVVTLNGSLLDHDMRRSHVAVVSQFDRAWTWLTVREEVHLTVRRTFDSPSEHLRLTLNPRCASK